MSAILDVSAARNVGRKFPALVGAADSRGEVVRWPYLTVPTAPIDERDVAAVAVDALCDDGHAGAEYILTGPQSLSQFDQVSTIGRAIGRSLRIEEMSPDEARRELATIMPASVVKMLLDAWSAGIGQPAFVTSSVAEITGKPARTFLEWATVTRRIFECEPSPTKPFRECATTDARPASLPTMRDNKPLSRKRTHSSWPGSISTTRPLRVNVEATSRRSNRSVASQAGEDEKQTMRSNREWPCKRESAGVFGQPATEGGHCSLAFTER